MFLRAQLDIKLFKTRNLEIELVHTVVRHGFNTSSTSSIFILQVMSYGLELELERTVTNALSKCRVL